MSRHKWPLSRTQGERDAKPATRPSDASGGALRAVCRGYLEFATERPALYQAMFVLPTDLTFASAETPAPLRACFDEFVSCFRQDDERRELFAEVVWSALRGMAVLSDSGRIPRPGRRSGSTSWSAGSPLTRDRGQLRRRGQHLRQARRARGVGGQGVHRPPAQVVGLVAPDRLRTGRRVDHEAHVEVAGRHTE